MDGVLCSSPPAPHTWVARQTYLSVPREVAEQRGVDGPGGRGVGRDAARL